MINKYLKRPFLLLLTVLLIISSLCPAIFASEQRVYDEANLLSTNDIAKLEETIVSLKNTYKLDIVIVTTNDTQGKTATTYADDFYDQNGFGYNGTYDGILLLIDMGGREVAISTDGEMLRYFTDERISMMLDGVTLYLGDGKYYEAANRFLKDVQNFMEVGIPANQYTVDGEFEYTPNLLPDKPFTNKYGDPLTAENILLSVVACAILSGIIALIVRACIIHSYKHPRFTVPQTRPDDLSVHYNQREDHYIRSFTNRVRVSSDSSHGGGGGGGHSGRSSSHHSSGGHTHGGGSRKF